MKPLYPVTFVALCLAPATALAQTAWVASASHKVLPGDAAGTANAITLEAARNEFEAFHVVLNGGDGGARTVTVSADALRDDHGNIISDSRVYREAWYPVTTPSNLQGSVGRWPDAMIPAVDEIDEQPRNAFPYDVPAGEQQPVFVEYHVPASAPPGWYSGTVHVSGGVTMDIAVKLYVHAFTLPSTASLPTSFGIGWSDPCIAHVGGYQQCGGDAGTQAMLNRYTRFALDHRITLSDVVYSGPLAKSDGSYDWDAWDRVYQPMMDGAMGGRLVGAKLTAVRFQWTPDTAHFAEWAKHFRAKGWLERTFDYTCDEPPMGCAWSDITARAALVHAGDPEMQTMVTTSVKRATDNGVLASIDTLAPTINGLDPIPPEENSRALYQPWLGSSTNKRLWIYQSCDSHSCSGIGDDTMVGWPSYMIDVPATQNRAMEWQAWRQRVQGELYYDTTYAFTHGDAWTNQYYFGGNGDGTLFYPGTPAKIGGSSQIPIASLRLKMMREGQEDYEYLKLLADAGDVAMADAEAAALSPDAQHNSSDPAAIDAARRRIALRIEELTGAQPPAMGPGTGGSAAASGPQGGTSPGSGGGSSGGSSSSSSSNGASGNGSGDGGGGCSHGGRAPLDSGLVLLVLGLVAVPAARRRMRF